MKNIFTASAVIVTALLLGAPNAMAQTRAAVVDAVLTESDLRGWPADDPHRFEHPTRSVANARLARCFQEALASGDHPEIEAAFLANKAYIEAGIPLAVTFASDPANNWNEHESTYLAFQLMNQGEDAEAQSEYFTGWIIAWGAAFEDDTGSMDVSDIDFSAQAAVEAMYDACDTTREIQREGSTDGQALVDSSVAARITEQSDMIHITWEADILPGGLEAMSALAEKWEAIAAQDPNTLYTKWVITEDSTAARLDALFVDGESAQAQFPRNLWHHLDGLIASGKIDATAMVIGGNLSEYTEFLRDFKAKFMVPLISADSEK
jgi:hypothetical protein